MSKTHLPYDPDQQLLLPAALREWLSDDHLAYFISDVVDQLHLSEITARYEGERRGGPPDHPRMKDRPTAPRGHRLSGVGGQQQPRTSAPSPTSARTTWRR